MVRKFDEIDIYDVTDADDKVYGYVDADDEEVVIGRICTNTGMFIPAPDYTEECQKENKEMLDSALERFYEHNLFPKYKRDYVVKEIADTIKSLTRNYCIDFDVVESHHLINRRNKCVSIRVEVIEVMNANRIFIGFPETEVIFHQCDLHCETNFTELANEVLRAARQSVYGSSGSCFEDFALRMEII